MLTVIVVNLSYLTYMLNDFTLIQHHNFTIENVLLFVINIWHLIGATFEWQHLQNEKQKNVKQKLTSSDFSPTLSTSKVSLHIKFITHILLYDIQCHKNIKCRHMSLYHNSFSFEKKAPFIVIFFYSHEIISYKQRVWSSKTKHIL